jgi:glycosyltransferase involved in cell wall biosynthesis
VRVYFDAQALQSQSSANRGIARYVRETLRALSARHPDVIAAIVFNPVLGHAPPGSRAPLGPTGRWNTAATFRAARARTIAETGADMAYHVLSPFEEIHPVDSMLPRHAFTAGVPIVATVYDLIPLELPDIYLPTATARRRYLRRLELLRSADLLIAISQHARQRTIEVLGVDPGRVHVSGCGVSEFFSPPPKEPTAAAPAPPAVPGITRPYVLTVTGDDPRKNAIGLITAWAKVPKRIRERCQLVVVGRAAPAARASWTDHARALGLAADELVITDFVHDTDLRELYRRCALFVFASFSEGFGLPAAEAARCGAVVITSDTTALPEVLELPEATFPPTDPHAIASLIERGLDDDGFRERVRTAARDAAERHTWTAVADRMHAAYRTVVRRPPTRLAPRPRVAVIGPLEDPTEPSGSPTARLAAALAHHADVDCLRTDPPRLCDSRLAAHRTFPARALGRSLSPGGYEAIVAVGDPAPDHARWVTLRLPSVRDPGAAADAVLAHIGAGSAVRGG